MDLGKLLAAIEESDPIDAVDVLAAELADMVDASHVSLLIANFSGNAVVRLSHVTSAKRLVNGHNERVESLALSDSVYQRVLFTQNLEVAEDDEYLVAAAHALAYVLITSRRHTDLFEWAQRDIPFSLAAEIQRRLLPSAYTAERGSFTIAGWLEPAHDAGGDTFDYSIDREFLYASITDAMGHSTQAALLATLAVGSLRNSRRALASPAPRADAASTSLVSVAGEGQFVTGQLIGVRLADGAAELVNAGHPKPYLLRAGRAARLEMTRPLHGPDSAAPTWRSPPAGYRRLP